MSIRTGTSNMQQPLTLATDLDGVGYRFEDTLRSWLHTRRGVPLSQLAEPHTYDLARCWNLGGDAGLIQAMVEAYEDGVLFHTGEPYKEALTALQQVREQGVRIVVITARNIPGISDSIENATRAWLESVDFPYDDLIVTGAKNQQAFDLLVDDCPAQVQSCLDVGRKAMLLSRRWNLDAPHLPRVDWAHVPALLTAVTPHHRASAVPSAQAA